MGVLAGRALGPPGGGTESGFAALFGVGYLLHLAQDARTPRSVPFWMGIRPLLRVFWFGVRLAIWPLWLVVPALNPFARPEVVEVRLDAEAPPAESPLPPEAVRCPRYGAGHHPAASYCQVCGAALQAGGSAAQPGPSITRGRYSGGRPWPRTSPPNRGGDGARPQPRRPGRRPLPRPTSPC